MSGEIRYLPTDVIKLSQMSYAHTFTLIQLGYLFIYQGFYRFTQIYSINITIKSNQGS